MAEAQPRPSGSLVRRLAAQPVVKNAATSGLISAIAELLRHWLMTRGKAKLDTANVMRQFAIGSLVVSPLATNWFALVERLFRKWEESRFITVLAKTALEQIFFAPVVNVAFMGSQGLLEGQSPEEVRADIQSKFVEVMKGNFVFWVPTGLISYRFVPPHRRVLFADLMSVLWTIYLINKTSKAAEPKLVASEVPVIQVTPAEAVRDVKVADALAPPPPAKEVEAVSAPGPEVVGEQPGEPDVEPQPTTAPARPSIPVHAGEWVVDRAEGDWDAFLIEQGLGWAKRKAFAAAGYGKNRIRMTLEQDGDSFNITNVALVTTTMKFRVGRGKQDFTTMEGKPAVLLPSWSDDGQVLECQNWTPEGEELSIRRQFLEGDELVVDLISLKGVLARRIYRRA